MSLLEYCLCFGLTLGLSTVFAMGGMGSALALVPSLSMIGVTFELARALGLFVNSAATIAASVSHFWRGMLEIRFAAPLVVSILIATPAGAWSSQFVDPTMIRAMLTAFLIAAAGLLLVPHRPRLVQAPRYWPLVVVGGGVGIVSGMLGVGGGALIMPALILLGHDAKKTARATGFVIPFSSAGAFLTYLTFTRMDWGLLAVVGVAAVIGGALGATLMHHRLNERHIKRLIAVLLLGLAGHMIWTVM